MKFLVIIFLILLNEHACQLSDLSDDDNLNDDQFNDELTNEDISYYIDPDSSVVDSFEEVFGNPTTPSTQSGSDESSSLPQLPKPFYPNFVDLGNSMMGGSGGSGELSWWQRIKKAFFSLAHFTSTQPDCYNAAPMNNTDISGLMGRWYNTMKFSTSSLESQANSTTDYYRVCEETVYTQTGQYTFNKTANVYFRKKWMKITGTGKFISPGVVLINWKILTDLKVNNQLVYMILGTDYSSFIVGYNCKHGVTRPEVVIQTRESYPTLEILQAAYDIVMNNGLPMKYMICATGF